MKRKLPLISVFIVLLIGAFLLFQRNTNIENTLSVNELRNQHEDFLKNSPFKETLKLSKKERKQAGIPPNKYYERMWELTMNPSTGKPEPYKVLDLQKEILKKGNKQKSPGDATSSWESRGPNNVGGRTRVVLFDPNDTNNERVFAGGVSGGLWVTSDITDASVPWTQVSGVPGNMNISCITVDPNNSDIWYIGTGEQYTFGAAVGNGVYKTIDGGTNWTHVPVQLAGGGTNGNNLAGIYYINDIIAWNNGGNTEVFIGVGTHVYGDSANPTNWLGFQNAGLYRTTDDGANWNRIQTATLDFSYGTGTYYYIPNDFEVSANNTLWFGSITTPGTGGIGGGQVFSSTNGTTWTLVNTLTNSDRVELAVSSSNANKMYALTEGTTSAGPHIYSTTNAFSSFSELGKPNDTDSGIPASDFTRGQAFYDLVIEVDPTDDDTFYVGGIDLFKSTSGTTTAVNDWDQMSLWYSNGNDYVHADQHAFTFRPGSNGNQVAVGCDGGVFYTSDLTPPGGNFSWIEREKDYVTTQFYYGGFGPSNSTELLLAGAQDNGSQFINGATAGLNSSSRVYSGDGAYSTIDKDGNYMIVSYVYNDHAYLQLPYTGSGYYIDQGSPQEGDFINQAGLDHNLDIMYSNGSGKINRYTLGSSSSTKVQLSNALLGASPTAFKVSPYTTTSSTLLVGTENSKLLRLTGANGSSGSIVWEEITGPSFVGSVSDIEFGETEEDIFVTFHNYGVTSIWYSNNGGITWKSKEGNLPDMPVKCILQNPLARNEVIVGTELGVWSTTNFHEDSPNWVSSYNGMQDVKVVDLDLRTADNAVMATTFGRGVFTGSFTNSTSSTFTLSTANDVIDVCKPANNAIYNIDFTTLGGYNSNTTFSLSGNPSGSQTFSSNPMNSAGALTLTVQNLGSVAAGEYTITLTGTGSSVSSIDLILNVVESTIGSVSTTSPVNESIGINTTGNTFSWDVTTGATDYDFEISSDTGFSVPIETVEVSTNSYTSSAVLNSGTVYYWRVRAKNNCISSDYSQEKSFQTSLPSGNCTTYSSTDTPTAIADGVPLLSVINVGDNFTLSDVNVSVDISHTWISDLDIKLTSPNTTEVVLFQNSCSDLDDLNVVFDDQASGGINCTTRTGTIQPFGSLNSFNSEASNGNWTLRVYDGYVGDTGTLNSWSVELCESTIGINSSLTNNPFTVGTNSSYIVLQTDLEATSSGSTAAEQQFMISELPTKGEVRLNNTALGLGEIFTQDDINNNLITYVNSSSVSDTDSFKVDVTNATYGFLPNQLIDVTIDASLSVEDLFFEETKTNIWPTVTKGSFYISSQTELGNTAIELYSITGQRVFREERTFYKGNVEQFNYNRLSTGVYIVKIQSGNRAGSRRIIVNY